MGISCSSSKHSDTNTQYEALHFGHCLGRRRSCRSRTRKQAMVLWWIWCYGGGYGWYGRKRRDAESNAVAEPESKPWYYGGYGGYGGGYGWYGRKRRDADSDAVAEPESKPWYYGGYGGY